MYDSTTFFQTGEALQQRCPRCGHSTLMHRLGRCREVLWPPVTTAWDGRGGFLASIPMCGCDALMCRECAHSVTLHGQSGCEHRTSDPYGPGEPDCKCTVPAIEIWKSAYDFAEIRELHRLAHVAPDELAQHQLHSGNVVGPIRAALAEADGGNGHNLSMLARVMRNVEEDAGEIAPDVAEALDVLERYGSFVDSISQEHEIDGVPPLQRVLQWAEANDGGTQANLG